MGLFSRKDSSKDSKPKKRITTSNETEIKELKVRARRRLIGSIVLILLAVIVVPMMFDDVEDSLDKTPVVLPAPIPQTEKPQIEIAQHQVDIAENEVRLPENAQEASELLQAKSEQNKNVTVESDDAIAEIVKQNQTKTQPKPVETPKPATEKPVVKEIKRSDDGSEALALLQGITPEKPSSNKAASGNFILQIAAYSTELDANTRRDKLIESGISNAYVEQANSNGRTTYRLRVGSFKTRQAAQAAQTRIRALGYDNSLLISQ